MSFGDLDADIVHMGKGRRRLQDVDAAEGKESGVVGWMNVCRGCTISYPFPSHFIASLLRSFLCTMCLSMFFPSWLVLRSTGTQV